MLWRSRRAQLRPQPLHRLWLRRAARRYAVHGWDVVPGACLAGTRFDCGEPGCRTVACHPALPDWERQASHDPKRIADWWRHLHHGVLLATGHAFDVLELPATLGRAVVPDVHGPVAVAPPGRWMFLIRSGAALRTELALHLAVVLHGTGSWVPAPPTRLPTGSVRWEIPPDDCDWQLPDPYALQRLVVRALNCQAGTSRPHLNRAA